jgi:exodeoxyribonuclease VII large subunit
MVAYKSLKTPTAVADFIVNAVAETENYLVEMSNSISELSLSLLGENRNMLDKCRMKLIPMAVLKIADEKKKLSTSVMAMISKGREYLFREGLGPASSKSRLVSAVRYYSGEREKNVMRYLADLKMNSIKQVKLSAKSIETISNNLLILNPENVLKRGYTITSLNGCIIKSGGILKDGDIIDTQFSEGAVRSKVTKNK